MADQKISAMTDGGAVQATDNIPVVRGGANYRVRVGSAATKASGFFLQVENNLDDLDDAATARTNLGLGSAAEADSADFATAVQGGLADTALQPVNNLDDLDDAATARTNLGLGSAAEADSADFATSVQGGLADTALQPANNLDDLDDVAVARTNLGLGSAAEADSADFATSVQGGLADTALQPANNLDDVADVPTSAANLGLGSSNDVVHKSMTAYRPSVAVTATAKTIGLSDANTFQDCNTSSAQVITIPLNATTAFSVDTEVDFFNHGSGQVSFTGSGGVTIVSKSGNLKLTAQGSGGSIRKLATDTWMLVGDLSA